MVHGPNNIHINLKRKLKVYTCNKAKHIIFVILMYIKIIIINTHDNTFDNEINVDFYRNRKSH